METNYKELLEQRQISVRNLAEKLAISPSVVSQVLSNKYTGSESTKEKVLNYIKDFVLEEKTDLNPLIYNNGDLFERVLAFGMKSAKFDLEETQEIINVLRIIKNYNESHPKKEI